MVERNYRICARTFRRRGNPLRLPLPMGFELLGLTLLNTPLFGATARGCPYRWALNCRG